MDVKLVMFRPNGDRKDVPVAKELVVLGRGEECDLRIPLGDVSRRHCEISLSQEQVSVKDLASANGTYVNSKRVNESPLAAGDRLAIGPVVFTVQIDGQPEEISPVKPRSEAPAEADKGADEIVDLEADVAPVQDEIDEAEIFAAADDDAEEVDPIAALEALAAEGQKRNDDELK